MPSKAQIIRASDVFKEPGFPLCVRRIGGHPPTNALHSHEFHELVVILSGHGRHLTDYGDYPIAAGDVFVIQGDMRHGYADTDRMDLVNILFDPRRLRIAPLDLVDIPGYHALFTVEPRLRGSDRFRSRLQLGPERLAEAATLVAALEDEMARRHPGYRFMAANLLLRLIGYLSRCYSRTEQPATRSLLRMSRVLSFMETRCDRRITVSRLTRIAAMSESTLSRMFRKVVGRPPIDHLIRVRVARARHLLTHTDERVTDIAFQCGFNDSNYFSRQFRKVTGQSPRDFRRAAAARR